MFKNAESRHIFCYPILGIFLQNQAIQRPIDPSHEKHRILNCQKCKELIDILTGYLEIKFENWTSVVENFCLSDRDDTPVYFVLYPTTEFTKGVNFNIGFIHS